MRISVAGKADFAPAAVSNVSSGVSAVSGSSRFRPLSTRVIERCNPTLEREVHHHLSVQVYPTFGYLTFHLLDHVNRDCSDSKPTVCSPVKKRF